MIRVLLGLSFRNQLDIESLSQYLEGAHHAFLEESKDEKRDKENPNKKDEFG